MNLTVSVKKSEDLVVVKVLHLLRALTSSMHVFMLLSSYSLTVIRDMNDYQETKTFKRNVSLLNQSFIKTLRFQEMNLSDFHSQSRRHRLQDMVFPCWILLVSHDFKVYRSTCNWVSKMIFRRLHLHTKAFSHKSQ